MFVSVTRLHLRSKRFLLPFLLYTLRSSLQLRRAPGFRGGVLGNDAQGGNWTITRWDGDAPMRTFRNSGPHAVAMRKLLDWCDEASYTHFIADDGPLPTADAAYERLRTGKTSKVHHPSAAQNEGHTVSEGVPRFALHLNPR